MKRLMPIALVVVLLLLSGCGIWNPSPNSADTEYKQFYQGTEGVIMRFSPGTPPMRVQYHAGETNAYGNSFDILVELHNMGASDAIGALYISGYDPNMIHIDGMDLQRTNFNDCWTSFGSGGGSGWDLGLGCVFGDGVTSDTYLSSNGVRTRMVDVMDKFGLPVDMVDFGMVDGKVNIDVAWDLLKDDADYFNHGRLLAMMLSSLDFTQYHGYPFNTGIATLGDGILRGDNYFYPGGEFAYQTFTASVYDWPQGLDETTVEFQVDACYGYTTFASPMICIDPAPYEDRDKVCYPQEYSWSGSQGAPVAITSLKQDPSPYGTLLTFTVRNVGTGEVIHPGYLGRCSPYYPGRLDSRHKDVVYIGDIRIGDQRLLCTPSYEVRLTDGVGTFSCEYEMEYAGSKNAYETPVVVELWYGYHDSITTQTLIKRVG